MIGPSNPPDCSDQATWTPGPAPVAVVMISLNEGHNMQAVLDNLKGWAQEVFLVDSYSSDDTVGIALRNGVCVMQHAFHGFGDQWNVALRELPISAPWTMKLDPDERISDSLKQEILQRTATNAPDGFSSTIQLFFMRRRLPVRIQLVRVWRTGRARFNDVTANEHALIDGSVARLKAVIEHHDSPCLEHWLEKQNRYTSAEAAARIQGAAMAAAPRLFGTKLQRRMWVKQHFFKLPFRYTLLFAYNYLALGAWRAGWVGYAWARLRSDVYRMIEYKTRETQLIGQLPTRRVRGTGKPDPRVPQYD